MKEFMIGVDSGGSSTIAEAFNLEGERIGQAKTSFGNPLVDETKALEHLSAALEQVLSHLKIENCRGILFGIAGVDTGNYKERILHYFSSLPTEIIVINDAWLAHYAHLKGADGCLVIAGTGSIAIGRYQHRKARVGGWGHLLGDEGSGYAIAKQLIVRILDAEDKGQELTSLETTFMNQHSFSDAFALSRFVYTSTKNQLAEIAHFIAKEAEKQNTQAISILEQAGQDLAIQTIQLIRKLNMQDSINVAVTGSVLTHNDFVFKAFREKILLEVQAVHFIRENQSNTIGAYYYFTKKQTQLQSSQEDKQ